MCKFRVRHICRQTCTDVDSKIAEIAHKPINLVDQSDLEFVIPEDDNSYIDLNMQIYVKSQLIGAAGAVLDEKVYTAGINNFLHSLFSQCNIKLNGVSITR
jgi:hypothetical protein